MGAPALLFVAPCFASAPDSAAAAAPIRRGVLRKPPLTRVNIIHRH